ncbi:MAG: dTMP kinase [Proteobacteria bacterium]|nr:dTMP kinase [Pseudomonadota bacterium]
MKKGLFITLEGIEGVGKSTHAVFITELLQNNGHEVTLTREPGGTGTGEAIREILLHHKVENMADVTELLLIFSARAQHLDEVIRPALAKNTSIVCDRFTDATYAYQGGGRGLGKDKVRLLEDWVQEGLKPDLTLLFDAPVATGLSRAKKRSTADRFESETIAFFEQVRSTYLDIARAEPERVYVIDAAQSLQQVQADISELFKRKGLC